jgi:AcrR family transcriptional regulator
MVVVALSLASTELTGQYWRVRSTVWTGSAGQEPVGGQSAMKAYNDDKQTRILDAAAELFASRPFHKVLLSDVARTAAVGKGTLYLYFESKDELYLAVLFREFSSLVVRLREQLSRDESSPEEQMVCIVRDMVLHLFGKATIVELLRGAVVDCPRTGEWNEKRLELRDLVEGVIRRGIAKGVFQDENPRLTAQYIPGLIRSVCLFRPDGVDMETVSRHACDFIFKGIQKNA